MCVSRRVLCLSIVLLSAVGFTTTVIIFAKCRGNDDYNLVPCMVWTTVELYAPQQCQVIRYKQELVTSWKRGEIIERCHCDACPNATNATKTQCWYDDEANDSKRFKDSDPKRDCTSSTIALIVFSVLFGMSVLVYLVFVEYDCFTRSSAPTISQTPREDQPPEKPVVQPKEAALRRVGDAPMVTRYVPRSTPAVTQAYGRSSRSGGLGQLYNPHSMLTLGYLASYGHRANDDDGVCMSNFSHADSPHACGDGGAHDHDTGGCDYNE